MNEKSKIAMENFGKGYNCCQAVISAYENDLSDLKEAKKMASSLGGGVGGMRQACGALLGMAMVCGAKYGYDTPEKGELKKEQTARTQKMCKDFESNAGSIVCKELLEKQGLLKSGLTCKELVGLACDILEK